MTVFDVETFRYFQLNYVTVLLAITLGATRTLGFTLSFVLLIWALPQVSILRISIALVLGLPVAYFEFVTITALLARLDWLDIGLCFLKEVVIGYSMGFLASIPFWALQFGGSIIDASRGESNPGSPDPSGGEIPTLARLYIVTGFLIFASIGGVWLMASTIYKSYAVWGITSNFPTFSPETVQTSLSLLDYILSVSVIVAAPLMFLMLATDFAVLLAAKMVKGLSPLETSNAIKGLLTLVTLPFMTMMIVQLFETNLLNNFNLINILKDVIK